MDLDADGKLDMISGSYDPGSLHLFRGLGQGKFAKGEVVNDRDGKPILKTPDQKEPVESYGSWASAVDWDDDGDLDVLVGTFEGLIFLRRNEGTRAQPAYARTNEWVKVGAKILKVPGGEHANPVIADWDGDGRWDIVTGAGDGGVYWYRNIGDRARPNFDAPVTLVAKHEGLGYNELLQSGQEPKPGIRTQIAVTDHDGDGKLDLLVGDFATNLHIRPDLTLEQRQEFTKVVERQNQAIKHLRGARDDVRARFKAEMEAKGVKPSDWNTPENAARWQAMYTAMEEAPEFKENSEINDEAEKRLPGFMDLKVTGLHLGKDPAVSHGYVWLFRRK